MKYKIVYVAHKLPEGFIGNNYFAAAAHRIPFPYGKDTVLVDSKVGKEVKRHSKNHEILEATAMSKEYKKSMSHTELMDLYHKCHAFALKNEKIDVETSEDAERLMDNKMAKFLEYLKGNMSTSEVMGIRKQDLPGTTSGDHSAYDRSGFLSREKDLKEFPQIPQKKDEEMVIQSDVTGMPIDRFPIYLQEYEALYHAQLSVPDVDIISHAELLTLHRFSGDSKYMELIKQRGMVGEPVIAWGPACLDQETRIFTKRGLLSYNEVVEGDEIFSIDTESDSLVETTVGKIHIYNHDGMMWRTGSKNVDLQRTIDSCVTGNHRVLQRNGSYKQADKLFPLGETVDIPTTGVWEGNDISLHTSDWIDQSLLGKNTKYRLPEVIPLRPFLTLAGWYVSEGSPYYDGGIVIWQSQKQHPQYVEEIMGCAKELGLNPIVHKSHKEDELGDRIFVSCVALNRILVSEFGAGSRGKRIPRWLLNSRREYIQWFMESCCKGDGRYRSRVSQELATVSKELARDYAEAALKLGKTTRIQENEWDMKRMESLGHLPKSKGYYLVSLCGSDEKGCVNKDNRDQVYYNGKVWCVSVSNGPSNFLVQRGTHMFFTGNSVEVIDRQGHMIPLSPLKDAFSNFMRNFRMRNGIVLHTDAQVASIIPCYIDKSGKKYASGVNHYGLYILCEIRRDGKIAERVRNEVLKGNIRSFSIAGIATDKHQVVAKSGKSFLQIDALELSEISLVERPANQDANFKLIKESDHLWTDIMKYLPTEQCDLSDGVVYTDENTIWIRTEPGSLMGEYIKSKLLENLPDDLKAQLHIVVTHDFNEIQKSDYRAIYKAALCPIAKVGEGIPESKKIYPTQVPANLPRDIQGKTIARVFKDEPAPVQKAIPVLGALLGGAGGGGGAAGVATQAAGAAASAAGGGGDDDEVEKQTQLTPASCDMASEKDVDTVRPDLSSDGTPRGDRDARGIGRTLGQSSLSPEPNEPVPLRDQNELNKAGQPSQQDPWASGSYQVSPVQVNAVKSKGDVDADIKAEEEKKKKEQETSNFEGEEREKTIIRPNSGMPFIEEKKPERPKDGAAIMPATASTGYTGSTST